MPGWHTTCPFNGALAWLLYSVNMRLGKSRKAVHVNTQSYEDGEGEDSRRACMELKQMVTAHCQGSVFPHFSGQL